MARFLVDGNMPTRTAEVVRSLGHDAVDIRDVAMASASDQEILRLCRAENRTVVTRDRDFGDLAIGQSAHPGVVLLRLRGLRSPAIIQRLAEALVSLGEPPGGYSGKIIVIEPSRVRIRAEGPNP